jgi:hypothetical protein
MFASAGQAKLPRSGAGAARRRVEDRPLVLSRKRPPPRQAGAVPIAAREPIGTDRRAVARKSATGSKGGRQAWRLRSLFQPWDFTLHWAVHPVGFAPSTRIRSAIPASRRDTPCADLGNSPVSAIGRSFIGERHFDEMRLRFRHPGRVRVLPEMRRAPARPLHRLWLCLPVGLRILPKMRSEAGRSGPRGRDAT